MPRCGEVDACCECQGKRAVEARVNVDQLPATVITNELKLGKSGITSLNEESGAADHELLVWGHADGEAARAPLEGPGSARLLLKAADHPSSPIEHERERGQRPRCTRLNQKGLVRWHPDEPGAELTIGVNRLSAHQGAAGADRLQHERGGDPTLEQLGSSSLEQRPWRPEADADGQLDKATLVANQPERLGRRVGQDQLVEERLRSGEQGVDGGLLARVDDERAELGAQSADARRVTDGIADRDRADGATPSVTRTQARSQPTRGQGQHIDSSRPECSDAGHRAA